MLFIIRASPRYGQIASRVEIKRKSAQVSPLGSSIAPFRNDPGRHDCIRIVHTAPGTEVPLSATRSMPASTATPMKRLSDLAMLEPLLPENGSAVLKSMRSGL
jgi:hypothetical protein